MAKFGEHSVSAIEYDFTKWGGPKGSVPEPTDAGIKKFFKTVKESVKKLDLDPDNVGDNPDEITQTMSQLDEDSLFEIQDEIADAIGELCQGKPSKDDVKALPFRVKQAFFGFIMGELQSPEESSGGTTPSLKAVRNA